jgi:signal transduction histidine kinase
MNEKPFLEVNRIGREGFWEEISQSAPKTWLITSIIGFFTVSFGIPTDFFSFKNSTLTLALLLRSIFLTYFLVNIIIAIKYQGFVKRHYQSLMVFILYIVGIPISLMGALTGDISNFYFMGIIEVEFAAATFFTISRNQFIGGVITINGFYILSHLLLVERSEFTKFTNIGTSLLIFAGLAIYAHHTILDFKFKNYLKRVEVEDSQKNISNILSRITDAFFALDNSWQFTFFNREAENLLSRMKRSKETLLGKSLWEEFPGLSDSTMRNEFLQSKDKNTPVTFEEYYPLMDTHMEVHAYPASEGISVYLKDISIRKIAEASLRKSHEELEHRVLERTAELRELSAHTDTLREEEWKRISREIHDELGQTLTGLKISISCLRDHLGEMDENTKRNLNTMSNSVTEMIAGVRRIAAELRPVVIDDLGLAAAVDWYVNNMGERGSIHFKCSIDPEEIDLDPERSIAIYRVLQEALNNAVRHSQATCIDVMLRQNEGEVILEVTDNGIGFTRCLEGRRAGGGLGLLGMKERVGRFEGSFSVNSQPGSGTTLRIVIPNKFQPNESFL